MLLTTVILGYLLGTREGLLEEVITMTRQGLPYIGPRIVSDLTGLAASWKALGWVSIVLVFLTAEFVLNATSTALQAVFDVRVKRGFLKKKVINAVILLIPVFTAMASITITAMARIVGTFDLVFLGFDLSYYVESVALTHLLPFFLMVIAVSVFYWVVGRPHINYDYSFYGGLIFAAQWEVLKKFFDIYISMVPTYNKFYVSVGTMMILLLYIYCTALVMLFSASVARAAFMSRHGPLADRQP
jgi:membrane protein